MKIKQNLYLIRPQICVGENNRMFVWRKVKGIWRPDLATRQMAASMATRQMAASIALWYGDTCV